MSRQTRMHTHIPLLTHAFSLLSSNDPFYARTMQTLSKLARLRSIGSGSNFCFTLDCSSPSTVDFRLSHRDLLKESLFIFFRPVKTALDITAHKLSLSWSLPQCASTVKSPCHLQPQRTCTEESTWIGRVITNHQARQSAVE